MPLVNGHTVDTGCWVDGHWGQYGPDRLAEQAETLGWTPADVTDDPRDWRATAENMEEGIDPHPDDDLTLCLAWERHHEVADDIEQWLNDHTQDGYSWGWYDGEFYLWPITEWEEVS